MSAHLSAYPICEPLIDSANHNKSLPNWRRIAIALIDLLRGEETARAWVIACLQELGAP